ncbi:hypothetical protein CF326_g3117 [Tilletia indica]|nr:hypothetical protein CF326_g3117 [Tilletia indica]
MEDEIGKDKDNHIKYVVETAASDEVADRLEQDEDVKIFLRNGKWQETRQKLILNVSGGTSTSKAVYHLGSAGCSFGRYDDRSLLAQEMERVLVAITGLSSLNSAAGGFYFPWDHAILKQSTESFRDPTKAYAGTSLSRRTGVGVHQRLRKLDQNFLTGLAKHPKDSVGNIIKGQPLQEQQKMRASASTAPASAVILKDITLESFQGTHAGRTSYFGSAPGPGPALEVQLWKAVEKMWTPAVSDKILHFPAAVFWNSTLPHYWWTFL